MSTPILAIDLGTTHAVMAHAPSNGPVRALVTSEGADSTPLYLHFYDGDGVVIGEEARRFCAHEPENIVTEFLEHLTEADWRSSSQPTGLSSQELTSLVLRKLVEDAEDLTGETFEDISLTVSPDTNSAQRQALKDAALLANLNVRSFFLTPQSTALGYGLDGLPHDKPFLLVDVGGRRTDVSVMRWDRQQLNILAHHPIHGFGGELFESTIATHLAGLHRSRHGVPISDRGAAQQKLLDAANFSLRALSTRDDVQVPIGKGPLKFSHTLTLAELAPLWNKHLRRLDAGIAFCLQKARTPTKNLASLLLAGGASRIRPLREGLSERLQLPILPTRAAPHQLVARGGALSACLRHAPQHPALRHQAPAPAEPRARDGKASGATRDSSFATFALADGGGGVVHLQERLERSVGLVAIDRSGTERVIELIPAGTKLPAVYRGRFVYAYDNMTAVKVEITEGKGVRREDVEVVGEVELTDLPPRPKGTPIEVIYRYDQDQILSVEVIDVETKRAQLSTVRFRGSLSSTERAQARTRTRQISLE